MPRGKGKGVSKAKVPDHKVQDTDLSPDESKAEAQPGPQSGRVLERPDGYYWESKATKELRGPFATRAEAEADLLAGGGSDSEFDPEAETLQEAESELGISEWIDPDTGGPAEDNVPRLEDH
jgi:hypothetical protein